MTLEDYMIQQRIPLVYRDGRLFFCRDLDLCDAGVMSLPEGLTVRGNLIINNTEIASLPAGLTIGGSLYLDGSSIASLPAGLTVAGDIYLYGSLIASLPADIIVGGNLPIWGSFITSLPEGLTVGGGIFACGCGITALPEKLTIGGSLDLRNTGITSLPKGLTIRGSLDIRYTQITSLPKGLTVGEDLFLWDRPITELPEGLVVGGDLDLWGTCITSLPEGMIIGGDLDLTDTSVASLPDNLFVGEDLDVSGTPLESFLDGMVASSAMQRVDSRRGYRARVSNLTGEQRKRIHDVRYRPIFWERGSVRYIKVDGIFAVIDAHHGNLYRVHTIANPNKQLYLVTDGENHWAHGLTLAQAKADLIYKINDRDTSLYESMTLDDTFTFEEAVIAYRTITGACEAGTRDYIENRLPKPRKERYTVREIIYHTVGEYGADKFMDFFKARLNRDSSQRRGAAPS